MTKDIKILIQAPIFYSISVITLRLGFPILFDLQ
jgi:hypothetical protein